MFINKIKNRGNSPDFCYTLIMLSKEDLLRRQAMATNVIDEIHRFFQSRGYLYFETPLLVKYPDMSPSIDPIVVNFDIVDDGLKNIEAALITSPEFSMKKLLGTGLEKIYTITPCFRAGESLKPHNTPEFKMLEWYRTNADYKDCIKETQELVNTILGLDDDWPLVRYNEANVDENEDPQVDFDKFFLIDYPVEKAALARLSKNGDYAERFEAYVNGIELCNGFSELIDAQEQRKRFEKEQEERRRQGRKVFGIDEELLEALEKIKKPVCGNALGVDRLIMLKYGISDINNIQLFPAEERFNK